MNAPNVQTLQEFEQESKQIITPPKFGAIWFDDAVRNLPPQKWLVDRVIPEDGLVVVYGQPGTAKTFFLTDLCGHVAQGTAWRERRVEKVGIVYVAAEGRAGYRKRMKGWFQENGSPEGLPFVAMTERVNLLDQTEVQAFIEAVKVYGGQMEERGTPLKVVVFDTLARCMVGGNENASEHMGLMIDNVDRIRRALGGITAIFAHHSPKDANRGPRGHTGLPGAADTMIELTKDESRLIVAKVGKQKDEEDGLRFYFRLRRVVVGQDAYGADETTCVVIDASDEALPQKKGPVLRGQAKVAYQCLIQALLDHGTQPSTTSVPPGTQAVDWRRWRDQCYRSGLVLTDDEAAKKKAFEAAGRILRERGWIAVSDPWVWQVR